MNISSGKRFLIYYIFLILLPSGVSATEESPGLLTLPAAEQLALDLDPVTKSFIAKSESLEEQAVADGQLSDPQLKLGVMSLPLDTFNLDQEPMTQLQVGIQQSFPPGDTLRYRKERTLALSDIEQARSLERTLDVLREVRIRYLQVYYQTVAKNILEENRDLFSRLLEITQRQYAAGRENQHDVLRAQLELSLIDDRILEIVQAREVAVAELGKYTGSLAADATIPPDFPELSGIPSLEQIKDHLASHPLIKIEDANLLASDKKISEVEQRYKPGFNLEVTYGERSARDVDGSQLPDMLTAMLLMDLPIFTDKRQDRQLAAAKKANVAMQFTRTDRLLEITSTAEAEYANWQRLSDRLALYEKRAVADAKMNADSTLKAYQNDVADFTTLMRAKLTELDTYLGMLNVRVERAKVQSKLLYLTGELK